MEMFPSPREGFPNPDEGKPSSDEGKPKPEERKPKKEGRKSEHFPFADRDFSGSYGDPRTPGEKSATRLMNNR
jgi:hypothetical protein